MDEIDKVNKATAAIHKYIDLLEETIVKLRMENNDLKLKLKEINDRSRCPCNK